MAKELSKLYSEMTVEEQLRYVTDLTTFVNEKLPVLEQLGDAWEASSRKDMETGLYLLSAFQYARDFVNKALMYGDYKARVGRIRMYIDKIKAELSVGMTITGSDGKTYAYVPPSGPLRRRGRPSKEEQAAKAKGQMVVTADDSPESRKRKTIARLLGLEVIVAGDAPREKNNAELAEERKAKEEQEAKANPRLFGSTDGAGQDAKARDENVNPAESSSSTQPSACAQLQMDSYELRMNQDKLHLNQLAWLCSDELKQRIGTVQGLRVTSEAASERAKLLAEQGANAEVIEPYAKQAQEAVEAYEAIYTSVDNELAVLHRRLTIDEPFLESFKNRFNGVDLERVLYITRPYYEKVKSPEFEIRVQALIEQESPAYAAKMKAEQKRKEEVADLLRYLKRKDKPNVAQRIKTMEERYKRLVELMGEKEAQVFRPIVDAAIEDYEKNIKPAEEAKKAKRGRPKKQIERES